VPHTSLPKIVPHMVSIADTSVFAGECKELIATYARKLVCSNEGVAWPRELGVTKIRKYNHTDPSNITETWRTMVSARKNASVVVK